MEMEQPQQSDNLEIKNEAMARSMSLSQNSDFIWFLGQLKKMKQENADIVNTMLSRNETGQGQYYAGVCRGLEIAFTYTSIVIQKNTPMQMMKDIFKRFNLDKILGRG